MSGSKDEVDAKGGAATAAPKDIPDGFHLHRYQPKTQTEDEFTDDVYKMNHKHRGVAVIFDNRNFKESTGLAQLERKNAADDLRDVTELLEKLGFKDIRSKPDMSMRHMKDAIREVSYENHQEHDCFVCVILSYGEEGYVWGVDDRVSINELMEPLKGNNCHSLAGKPKLFLVQADPQEEEDGGMEGGLEAAGEIEEDRRIPAHADLFMAVSVVPRHNGRSCFIEALYTVFLDNNLAELDLASLMTRVNRRVAKSLVDNKDSKYKRDQKLPCVTSMLTKDLFFC